MITHTEKPGPTYGKGRRCHDCGTIISVYVPGTRCRLHRTAPPQREVATQRERAEVAGLLQDILGL